jgi:hypothetical protein
MSPVVYCCGIGILLSGLATILFLIASMRSSRLSQQEESHESTC